ncbi:transposase family protein [Streptomyces sp. HC44]|uniref:Transposase family protein n=1 Tax=Streptomyces scabichelini TaxID=2711217 RepID=A0A6G4V3K3_9ACTN|nr:DDE-type integrase/transposase/recombinase [Streptomyces scabichelini]NGO08433.1 transposase family protein [Streptomyces scabichelini]
MSSFGVRVGLGTQFLLDGEMLEVVELVATASENAALLKDNRGSVIRMTVRELLFSGRARIVPQGDGPSSEDPYDDAATVLAQLTETQRDQVLERAAHVREVMYGFKSGSPELAGAGEPRPDYAPGVPWMKRYAAKATELGHDERTIREWVRQYESRGEAGLAPTGVVPGRRFPSVDERWMETALEIMKEYENESGPSRSLVISRTEARLTVRYGRGKINIPSRATAYRVLEDLEQKKPTFQGSSKGRRETADRPTGAYGRLRPTRPGEYVLMDTTRSDVFALDPITLRWVQVEITVAMDWYTRCITGLLCTPVSTKAVDACRVLYQTYRPPAAPSDWPGHAVWPEHGIPRAILMDREAIEGPLVDAAGPAIVPETIVVDHGKIYTSAHLTSVCRRMGISIQPARLRTGRDKGPIERFFRTLRQGLLEALPGYKGPDVHSRGLAPENDAYFFLDELESIIREWIALVYHHRPHSSLVDPRLSGLKLSPAKMFEHGIARAGYIDAPRDPNLAYEFLEVEFLNVHHYGVEIRGRRYNDDVIHEFRDEKSRYPGGAWPFHVNRDDINRIYFRHPRKRKWYPLRWEHAPSQDMPFSEEALGFARKLARSKYTYPDDRLAVGDLLERWNMGLGMSLTERRMALRLSREQQLVLPDPEPDTPADVVESLPSVRKVLEALDERDEAPGREDGDDDDELDLDDAVAVDDDFYADALEDI